MHKGGTTKHSSFGRVFFILLIERKIIMNKTFYVTTPIYYPSANLHIGHAYTTVIADALARYKRMRNYDFYFLTGSDEHGEKIQKKATENKVSPLEYTTEIVEGIKQLWADLDISNDDFIRTTDEKHSKAVQKIFTYFLEKGDIYKDVYEGNYCVDCEAFWTDAQLDENGNCPECGRTIERKSEESYFFRMSKYADQLVEYYNSHPDFIEPESRKNEMLNNFIQPGLEDLSISRTQFDWGIPVKEDPEHVIYVWIDALVNYLTALGYMSDDTKLFDKFWNEDTEIVQLVGKEIVRFHAIYWPIILISLGLRLPDKILAHGWIILKDSKMSKSLGNVIAPQELTSRYGVDSLRHYCLSQISLGSDGVYTHEQFLNAYNVDLANNLGNLLNRTVAMVEQYFKGSVTKNEASTDFDQDLFNSALTAIEQYETHMDAYHVDKASHQIFSYITRLNKYIDETQPWALAKDAKAQDTLNNILYNLCRGLHQVAIMLKPLLVETSQKMLAQLDTEDNDYEKIRDFDGVEAYHVKKGEPLFNRLNIDQEIKNLSEV
jgi:methionyl-tRNA synthetase